MTGEKRFFLQPSRNLGLRNFAAIRAEHTPIFCKRGFNRAQMSDIISDILSIITLFS